MIAFLLPWILAVPDDNYAAFDIDVIPGDLADLFQPHCCRNRKSNNPVQGDYLPRFRFEVEN